MTSNKFDPAEVLAYLNELGYRNITAVQLKEFMKDLKKLMKYEAKQNKMDNENVQPPRPPCKYNRRPVTSTHLFQTESSKAKQAKKKDIISVEIKKRFTPFCSGYQQAQLDTQNTHQQTQFVRSNVDKIIKLDSEVIEPTDTESLNKMQSTSPRPKSCDSDSCKAKSKVTFKEKAFKSKASFIVPRGPFKPHKSDPVALYHKYQKMWKKNKIPGEDNRNELRWAIRERLLGQPYSMSAAPSLEQITKKRVCSS